MGSESEGTQQKTNRSASVRMKAIACNSVRRREDRNPREGRKRADRVVSFPSNKGETRVYAYQDAWPRREEEREDLGVDYLHQPRRLLFGLLDLRLGLGLDLALALALVPSPDLSLGHHGRQIEPDLPRLCLRRRRRLR